MINSQKPERTQLSKLITYLADGDYGIPDFQREFKWKPQDINDLMKSIFSDYYIGTLLLWRAKEENLSQLDCKNIYGLTPSQDNHENKYIVLDGQQRLTAMYYSFWAPDSNLPGRSKPAMFHISIDKYLENDTERAFGYTWKSKGSESLFYDRDEQFSKNLFPLKVLSEDGFKNGLLNWTREYEKYWQKESEKAENIEERDQALKNVSNAEKFHNKISEIISHYEISYIELNQDIKLEKVCDIFTQINSRGIPLDVFDLLNALMKPKGVKLRNLYSTIEEDFAYFETSKMKIYILQVMSLIEQNYCTPKHLYSLTPGEYKVVRNSDGSTEKVVLLQSTDEFRVSWDKAVGSLHETMDMLKHPNEFGVLNRTFLPYVTIIVPLAALLNAISNLPDEVKSSAHKKVSLWYWSSVFQNRYTGAVDSSAAHDYKSVQQWFENDNAIPDVVEDFRKNYKMLDLKRETTKVSAVYRAIMNMLIKTGARDWITGKIIKGNEIDGHHIVPKSWGRKVGLGQMCDSILNKTLLSSETNRNVIRDRLPSEYMLEMLREREESVVRRDLSSHYLDDRCIEILLRNQFGPNDFEEFLSARERDA